MNRRIMAAVLVLAAAVNQIAAAQAPPPIEHYTRPALIDDVVPSPSGKRMAWLATAPNGRRQLAVMDLVPASPPRIVASFGDADVTEASWVNEDRLVFHAFEPGAIIREGFGGAFAVQHDGSGYRRIIVWRNGNDETGTRVVNRALPYGWFVHSMLHDGSNDILVHRRTTDEAGDPQSHRLARLDTSTGRLSSMNLGTPPDVRTWLLDSKHEPRMLGSHSKGRNMLYWRAPGSEEWTKVADFDGVKGEGFTPQLIDDAGRIYVTTAHGSDNVAVHTYDPVARQLSADPVVAVEGFDVEAQFEVDSGTRRLLGIHFRGAAPTSYWFDDALAKIQRGIDAALPGRYNRLLCGQCESSPYLVVLSRSDRDPGRFYLFNRGKATLESIGAGRPWLPEETQGRRSFHRVKTRDGMSMPVYVTHPAGAKPGDALPAVVLVHGGPWVRGSDLTWDAEAQFLASRGWRVIEPEFRGSKGYGDRLYRAGWKQWGLAMQDDLADAVQWAANEGLVDASRVCIMGGSYGGYAALMAPIRHPGVYRCAVSFAAVTDLDLMYSIHWSDTTMQSRDHYMPEMIGDREKDAAQLRATSPLRRVAEIKVPVLLAHGVVDRRVPIDHAKEFVAAARSAGVALEHVYYDHGHGWFMPAEQADFYSRVERFLAKSLARKP